VDNRAHQRESCRSPVCQAMCRAVTVFRLRGKKALNICSACCGGKPHPGIADRYYDLLVSRCLRADDELARRVHILHRIKGGIASVHPVHRHRLSSFIETYVMGDQVSFFLFSSRRFSNLSESGISGWHAHAL